MHSEIMTQVSKIDVHMTYVRWDARVLLDIGTAMIYELLLGVVKFALDIANLMRYHNKTNTVQYLHQYRWYLSYSSEPR